MVDHVLAVTRFREYLKIKSVHPNPDYKSAVRFLIQYAKELKIEIRRVEVGKDREVVVFCLPGRNPELPSILLNSHMDVVPVFDDHWKFNPWEATKDGNGNIYGRGAQDMKSVGIQYLEAIRTLKKTRNGRFERNVYISFVPDEEIGDGTVGMGVFVNTPEFEAMNVGFALDEGLANPENKYSVFYGERSQWVLKVTCRGNPGHGSRFIQNTAAEKLRKLITSFFQFRDAEKARLDADSSLSLGEVCTVNLTLLRGGVQPNVVPDEFIATFDIRVPPMVDIQSIDEKIATWCSDAGDGVTFEFMNKYVVRELTNTDKENHWWRAFSSALEGRGVEIVKEIFSASTDSSYLRVLGYSVIGFSPMRKTPILLHDHNEFLNETVFLEGIEVYCDIIPALANA